VFPEISAGLAWRYFVPEDEPEELLPASPEEGPAGPQAEGSGG
jgi:hypothetical protein